MAHGRVNVPEEEIFANIKASIRRGHPQMQAQPIRDDRVCLVGSGPSLNETCDELREALWDGGILVTMNGSYHWAIEHGFKPQTQIVVDARASNARFVTPAVPKCNYVLASQCHPAVFDAVEDRDHVWIFHAVTESSGPTKDLLDAYYQKSWMPVNGGVTVASRALMLLRQCGYVRFDLFGVDSCWHGDVHHAMAQPENESDKKFRLFVRALGKDVPFVVSPWHVKQAEDFLQIVRVCGKRFRLNVHGKGLLAYLVRCLAETTPDQIVMEPRD
jgi:hypothetical protein